MTAIDWVAQYAHTARALHRLSIQYRNLAELYPNSSVGFPDYEARYRRDAHAWLRMARQHKAGPIVLPNAVDEAA